MVKASDTANEATRQHRNKCKDWIYATSAIQRGNNKRWDRDTWKYNLFVHDMLYDAGIDPPPRTSGGWPVTAQMWTGSVDDFEEEYSSRPGDIVATSTHVGIVVEYGGSNWMISARKELLARESIPSSCTIQRHKYYS